jgi:glycosyltransferase involved in cell wall biosynthesis
MKIVYLAASSLPSYGHANSIQVMQMCRAFSRIGHEVLLFAPNKPETIKDVDVFEYYGVEKTFAIQWLPWFPIKGRGYIYGWLAAQKARKLQPDLVYGRSIAGCYFSALFGLPTTLEIHSPLNPREWLLNFMLGNLCHQAQCRKIVFTSNFLAQHLKNKFNIPDNLICVAPNGADDLPNTEPLLEFEKNTIHVGYIGNLKPGKGMEIIAQLIPLTPWAHYHVVGGGGDINYWLKNLADHKNITFYGSVAPAQTNVFRLSCDVLLAPYQRHVTDMDSANPQNAWLSPLKLMEYMAAGKPILCSNLAPYREILVHGRTALLCDPDQIDTWVSALKELHENNDLRKKLGEEARLEFTSRYTWVRRAENVLI